VAPAGVSNVLVAVSGVLQDPSTYGVAGTTITFSTAPPSGTGNISCRYLGVPVTGITTTAYRTVTEFTATAGQTTFTPPSYTPSFINVYLNGVLLGSADYTATNGTTVVLATGAAVGNLVTVESFQVSSVLNAIPNTAGAVSSSNIQTSVALTTPTIDKINTSVTNTSLGAGNASIMKNRIINGAMVIDQRNAGASVTPNNTYTLDRWQFQNSQTSKVTLQQNAGSVTPPVGFINYLGITSSSAYSVTSSDYFMLAQKVEGLNISDLGWGTANAKTVTLSFWIRSSLTGTFGGSLVNQSGARSYPFTYTINTANTWEFETITIAGDTSGTWLTTNGIGINIYFSVGAGSTVIGTAGAWASAAYYGATGQTSVVGTSGATFYITGVQLEVGSSATGFEYVNYQTSLANCQRYFAKMTNDGSGNNVSIGCGTQVSGTDAYINVKTPITMRTEPTGAIANCLVTDFTNFGNAATLNGIFSGYDTVTLNLSFASAGSTNRPVFLTLANTSGAYLTLSAEL
jgi:hypothetical protein